MNQKSYSKQTYICSLPAAAQREIRSALMKQLHAEKLLTDTNLQNAMDSRLSDIEQLVDIHALQTITIATTR